MIFSDDKHIVFIDMTLKNNQRLVAFTDIVFNFWVHIAILSEKHWGRLSFGKPLHINPFTFTS